MSPWRLTDWREIERAFCALCWLAAVALVVVIVGVAANGSSVNGIGRQAQGGPAGGAGPGVVLGHGRR